MTVISSTIRREGWTGSGNVMDGDKFQVEHLVESNDLNDGPLSVALGAQTSSPNPIPMPWATYDIGNDLHSGMVVKDRSTRLHAYTDTGALWIVTTKWEKPGEDDEEDGSGVHPLLRPIKYRVEWANYTRIVKKEVAGEMRDIVNACGDPFSDPVEQDDQRPVLVAVKNVQSLQYVIARGMSYKNAVNRDSFWGAEPRHAKVQGITAGDKQKEEDVEFYTMTIRVEFNEEKWDRTFIDQGMRYRKVAGAEPVAAKDSEGTPVGTEIKLSVDGTKLPEGDNTRWIDPPFRTYPERDFSGLEI